MREHAREREREGEGGGMRNEVRVYMYESYTYRRTYKRESVGTSYPNSHSIQATNFASSLIAGVTDSP